MKKITLSDFSRGMMQRVTPDDHLKGELGYTYGFVPEDNQSIRSQWPIQSIGGESREWVGTNITITTEGGVTSYTLSTGSENTSDVIAIYPINSTSGTYLVALKEDGTIWWTKAPSGDSDYATANACVWTQLVVAQNRGFDITKDYDEQPFITVESNPDYRFICELPLEVYKYIKEPTSASHVVYDSTALPTPPFDTWIDFAKDSLPVGTAFNDDTGAQTGFSNKLGFSRSNVSAVLIHSRRYYRDGLLTTGKDYASKRTVTNYAVDGATGTVTLTLGTSVNGVYEAGDTINVNTGIPLIDGDRQVISASGTSITYFTTIGTTVTTTPLLAAPNTIFKKYRTQTAVIAYVNPYKESIELITFPNFRRWPTYSKLSAVEGDGFSLKTRPIQIWAVASDGVQKPFPFLNKYPFNNGSITAPMVTDQPATATSWPLDANTGAAGNFSTRSAYPKPGNSFHPYTYLDKDKTLLPGRGLIPRAFTGTMFGSLLILGDMEWKEDSSDTFLSQKKLTPAANRAVIATSNADFGLRDGNTEPHRGYFYYSQDDIDVFDPRSVLRASGTDTRIAGMHSLNNRIIAVTTSGGPDDGVVTFTGNFGQLHPYQPGVLSNPLAVRKEVIGGGLGTADTEDYYNHGNPQTVLWGDKGVVAFIDKSGYVYITNGESVSRLSDRYPNMATVTQSTVNDHLAAVGRNLFIYKNGYLYCYTAKEDVNAWSILQRPQVFWDSSDPSFTNDFETYNVIRSMRGINNELYMVVHTYSYQMNWLNEEKTEAEYLGPTIRTRSRVMRYALSGPSEERGRQDNENIQTLFFATPALGMAGESKKINWNTGGLNFFTETSCDLYGVSVLARYTSGYYLDFWNGFTAPQYFTGTGAGDFMLDPTQFPNYALTEEPFRQYDKGYHNFEFRLGLGPQKVISVGAYFTGDVRIEGVNIWFTGSYNLVGQENE